MKLFGKTFGKDKYLWYKFYKKNERKINIPNMSL